jgi:hypothetical protein
VGFEAFRSSEAHTESGDDKELLARSRGKRMRHDAGERWLLGLGERSSVMTQAKEQTGSDGVSIRPFQVSFPEAQLTELRQRIKATRWPERETVTDDSQGVQLATMQRLARLLGHGHDWRKCEAS